MITQDGVTKALAKYLERQGWEVLRKQTANWGGYRVLARRDNDAVAINVQGATSGHGKSRRFGSKFNSSQERTHVSRALYAAAKIFSDGRYRPGIALPYSHRHGQLIANVSPVLEALDVTVFFVDDDNEVWEECAE